MVVDGLGALLKQLDEPETTQVIEPITQPPEPEMKPKSLGLGELLDQADKMPTQPLIPQQIQEVPRGMMGALLSQVDTVQKQEREEDLSKSLLSWEGITDIPEELVGGVIEGVTGLKFGRPETGVGKAVRGLGVLGGTVAAFGIPVARGTALGVKLSRTALEGAKIAKAAPVIGAAIGGAIPAAGVTGGQALLSQIQEGQVDPKEVVREAAIMGGISIAVPFAGQALRGATKVIPPSWPNPFQAVARVLPNWGGWKNRIGYQVESPTLRFIGLTPGVENMVTAFETEGFKSVAFNKSISGVLREIKENIPVQGINRTLREISEKQIERLAVNLERGKIWFGSRDFDHRVSTILGSRVWEAKLSNNEVVFRRTGQLLKWLQEQSRLHYELPQFHRQLEMKSRTMISHIMLGFGRLSSALVNFTQVANTLSKEGPEAVLWAWEQQVAKSPLYKIARDQTIGKGFRGVELKLGIPELLKTQKGRASMSFFTAAENFLRPNAFLARYYNEAVRMGIKPAQVHLTSPIQKAIQSGVRSARETQFDYNFDLPAFLRRSGIFGSLLRTHFQFFPFVLKQAEFVSRMNLREFINYMGYFTSLAGIRGVPFAVATDRAVAAFTHHSVLDNILADPRWAKLSRGVPGLVNIDIGRRLDWSQDLADRFLLGDEGAFLGYIQELGRNWDKFVLNPTDYNTYRDLAYTVLPRAIQDILKASEAASIGAFITPTEQVELEKPTTEEITATALGFQPVELARARAVRRVLAREKKFERKTSQELGQALRLAFRRGDIDHATNLLIEARERGMNISRLKRDAGLSPGQRWRRLLPRRLRTPENLELLESIER